MRILSLALLAAAATMPLVPAIAQMTPPPADAPPPPATPLDFVKQAGAGDKYEMDSSRLVLATTHDAKVRKFANQMIKDHTASTAQVKAAAMRDHVKAPPPMLMPMQQDMIAQLKAATGKQRDSLYEQQQGQAHQMALQLHQYYADNGTAPHLKMAAGKIAPVVQSHIDMLNGMGSMSGM